MIKYTPLHLFFLSLLSTMISLQCCAQNTAADPWKTNQLMPPSDLAKLINNGTPQKPTVFNIGPAGKIKGSINIGPAQEKTNLNKLKQQLSKLPKNSSIVIYCGCCPFGHCPNIRPAFKLLNEMKFTNHRLLNLPKNIKADWIDIGYPMD